MYSLMFRETEVAIEAQVNATMQIQWGSGYTIDMQCDINAI